MEETSVGEPLIMAVLTAIEGDMWRDETLVLENLGWPAYIPLTFPSVCVCVCVSVCMCVSVSSHCNMEEMLPAH